MAAFELKGRWGRALAIRLPHDALVNDEATGTATSVSCAPTGRCTIVGAYSTRDGSVRAYAARAVVGASSPELAAAVQLPFAAYPAAVGAGAEDGWLSSVSCSSAEDCVAVGSVATGEGAADAATVQVERDGAWGDEALAPVPPTAGPEAAYSWLDAVSCEAAARCLALGTLEPKGAAVPGPLVDARGPAGWVWTAPPTAPKGDWLGLEALSCAAARCVAVGTAASSAASDLDSQSDAAITVGTAGSLSSTATLSLPSGGRGRGNSQSLQSVACSAGGACTAVGAVADAAAHVTVFDVPVVVAFLASSIR
jgi:hypothetical protein